MGEVREVPNPNLSQRLTTTPILQTSFEQLAGILVTGFGKRSDAFQMSSKL